MTLLVWFIFYCYIYVKTWNSVLLNCMQIVCRIRIKKIIKRM